MQIKAKGKFLLTGEYLVLKGAKALALPLKFGQTMDVSSIDTPHCIWISKQNGADWFEAVLNEHLEIIEHNDEQIAQKLKEIILNILTQNPTAISLFQGKKIEFDTDFPRNWGLGTSSTLIALLGKYTQTNPYSILENSFGGSGYDLACAFKNNPIFYTRNQFSPLVQDAAFQPTFAQQLYFVYLGQKQNSAIEVKKFFKEAQISNEQIQEISQLSDAFCEAKNLEEFILAMNKHEQILSHILRTPTIQSQLFEDFDGAIKSMGAWGGDFVLVASTREENYVKNYFSDKGLVTILSYSNVL